jgi:outer membrane immunogenic protein
MKPVFRLLGLAAPIMFCVGHSQAADLGASEGPLPEIAAAPSVPTWAGAYLGIESGYEWDAWDTPGVTYSFDGALVGIYGGFNLQSGSFVYGLDASVDYSFAAYDLLGETLSNPWSANLRARVGVAMNSLLLYVAGGVAGTENLFEEFPLTISQWAFGWTAAVGAEYAFSPHLIGRLDVSYTDYDTSIITSTPVDTSSIKVKTGLALKF